MFIVIHNEKDYRLCNDGYWRSFASFGTFSYCVRIYKRIGYAQKAANRVKGIVVKLKEGESMDACGRIS